MNTPKASLHHIFKNGIVFAKDKPIRIFGFGNASEVLSVSFDGEKTSAREFKSNTPGSPDWIAEFTPRGYGDNYIINVEFVDRTEEITDASVGEVILLAGQSNIELKLRDTAFEKENWQGSERIRAFFGNRLGDPEHYNVNDGWVKCTDENAGHFSAIGYHIAHYILKNLNCAVGLVSCYQGASVIEAWMPRELAEKAAVAPEYRMSDHANEGYRFWNQPFGALYEKAFARLCPYSFSFVTWYQGESDVSEAEAKIYAEELELMVNTWRRDLLDCELYFYVIQIADCDARMSKAWRDMQAAQARACELIENAELVISRDVCETTDIHPRHKKELSERVARAFVNGKI